LRHNPFRRRQEPSAQRAHDNDIGNGITRRRGKSTVARSSRTTAERSGGTALLEASPDPLVHPLVHVSRSQKPSWLDTDTHRMMRGRNIVSSGFGSKRVERARAALAIRTRCSSSVMTHVVFVSSHEWWGRALGRGENP
jgi:hypothetical protein